MDEDRRDNNNEKVVVEKDKSNAGLIVALIVIGLILLFGYLAFQAADDSTDDGINTPETVDVNVDNPVDSPTGTNE